MSKSTKYVNKAVPCGCEDGLQGTGLICDMLELISTDNTVKITKTKPNGRCTFNLRVDSNGVLNKADSSTVQWEGNGKTTPLKANVIISEEPDNALVDNNGLFISNALIAETPNAKLDSSTILITLDQTHNRRIRADIKLSVQAGQALQVLADGLFVSTSGGAIYQFKPGDADMPNVGDATFSPTGNAFLNKKALVFRSNILQSPTNLGDGGAFFTKPVNSNTMTFSPALTVDDYIQIIAL